MQRATTRLAIVLVACTHAKEPPQETPPASDPWAATAPAPKKIDHSTDDCSSVLSDEDAKALGVTRRLGECTDFHHSLELVANGHVVAHVGVIHGMDKQVVFDRPLADAKKSAATTDPSAARTLSENVGLGDESFLLETRLLPASKMMADEAKLHGMPVPIQAHVVAWKGDFSVNVDANNFEMQPGNPTDTAKKIAARVISKL